MATKKRATKKRAAKGRTTRRRKTLWYKVIDGRGLSSYGGDHKWDLPKRGKPGAWTEEVPHPVICETGYHLVPEKGLGEFVADGEVVYIAEPKPGARSVHNNSADGKTSFSSVRLVKKVGAYPDWLFKSDEHGNQHYESMSGADILRAVAGDKGVYTRFRVKEKAKDKLIAKCVKLVKAAAKRSLYSADEGFIAATLVAHKVKHEPVFDDEEGLVEAVRTEV